MHKILHVISDTNIGGAGRLLLTFLAKVDRKEFDITVVLPKDSLLVPEINKLDIKTIETEGISDKTFSLKAIKNLSEIYKKEQPNIVHTHAVMSGRIAAKLAKIKVVHTRHSVHTRQKLLEEPGYKKRFPYKHLVGAVNNHLSDTIIASSPVAKLSMVETGTSQKKTVMIYNGTDGLEPASNEKKAALRYKFGIGKDDFVCTILARLEYVKGHRHVLKAAELLQREDGSIKFLIVGMGSEEEALKQQVEKLELKNVIFTGFIKEVNEVLSITDVQINASHTETTCLALLEGLSLGVPAIASDMGGNPFVINDGVNGILFDDGDYAAMAKAILSLRKDADGLAKLSQRAKEIFADRFDSKMMTTKVEKIYRDLLEVIDEVKD